MHLQNRQFSKVDKSREEIDDGDLVQNFMLDTLGLFSKDCVGVLICRFHWTELSGTVIFRLSWCDQLVVSGLNIVVLAIIVVIEERRL